MVSRRLVVLPAVAAALIAAARADAAPQLTPAVLQCDGATYLAGSATHTPNPTVRVSVQDSVGLRIGQQPMGVTGYNQTRELWNFQGVVTASMTCLGGATADYRYSYNDPNNSDTMIVGECQYSGCGPVGALSASPQIPLGQTACPASPPAVAPTAVGIFSGGQGGNFGTAATFDGTAVQFGSVTYNLTGLGDRPGTYTLSAWILSGNSGQQTIISEQEGGGGFWGFGINGANLELFDSRNVNAAIGNRTDVSMPAAGLDNGAWHKVDVVRINGSSENFYVDGNLIGFVPAASSASFSFNSSSSPIMIGTYLQTGTRNFDGQINQLRVEDAALSSTDILLEYLGSDLHYFASAPANPYSLVKAPPTDFNPAVTNAASSGVYYPGEAVTANSRWTFAAQDTQSVTTVLSTFTVTINTNPPSAPQDLVGTPTSINSILWSWSAPAFFCQSPGTAASSLIYQLFDAAGGGALSPPGNMVYTGNSQSITETYPVVPNQLHSRRLSMTDTWGAGTLAGPTSAYTLAAAPTALAATSVSTGGFIASWSVSGNPGYTRYEVTYTTDPNFVVGVSTRVGFLNDYTAASVGFTGLATGTTYYVRVRAFNGQASDTYGGIATAYDGMSVVTDAGAPSLSGTPLSNSSVQWNWTQVPGATGYTLYDTPTSAVLFGPNGAGVAYTSATLSPNTLYSAEVQAVMPSPAPPTGFGQAYTYTLANPPTAPVLSAVYATSATYAWGANGNPSYTFYQVVLSSSPTFNVVIATLSASAPTLTATGLLPGVVYYSSVAAVNGIQIPTAFVGMPTATIPGNSAITVSTSPATPYAASSGLVGAWQFDEDTGTTAGDSSGYGNTGNFLGCSPLSVCLSTPTWAPGPPGLGSAASFSGLSYGEVVTANGTPFNFTGSLTVEAWVYPQTAAQPSGAGVVTRGALGAEDFALVVSGSEAFQFLSSNGFSATVATATIVPGQWTHVVGVYDAATSSATLYLNGRPAAVTLGVPARTNHAGQSVVIGNWLSGSPAFFGRVDSVRIFNTAENAAQVLSDYVGGFVSSVTAPAPNAGIVVGLPPNAFGAPAEIYISANPVSNPIRVTPAALSAGLSVPPAGLSLVPNSLVEVVPVVSGVPFTTLLGSSATLTVPYDDPTNTGIVSGTNPPLAVSGLQMYTLNTAVNAWTPLPTYVNASNRTVTGVTPHFSVFGLFAPQTIGTSLTSLRVYPVPWKPGSGGRFDAPGVTFADLPASGSIRILTLSGQRVRDFGFNGVSAGTAVWDGTNDDGRRTASGVYFARITSGVDGSTTLVKFAIER